MSDQKEPCARCQALVNGSRHDKPHDGLEKTWQGKPYGHMFGGGVDSNWEYRDCGAKLFHSTDQADYGWQFKQR